MAGIGFELKKLFQKRGLAATAKAYGYAGVICTGPMLLGYRAVGRNRFYLRSYRCDET